MGITELRGPWRERGGLVAPVSVEVAAAGATEAATISERGALGPGMRHLQLCEETWSRQVLVA